MSKQSLSKRQGKAAKDGAGLKVYLKPEEAEKAGIKKGEKIDVTVNAEGSITIRPSASPSVYEKFLKDAVEGGVEFGEPIEMGDAFIIPIFAKQQMPERDYVTVPEALDLGWLRFTDTGIISGVHVTNTGNKGVLIIAGQVLEGGTQPRTVITNLILAPNQNVVLPSRCVHSSRPITANAKMTLSGMTPRNVAFGIMAPSHKVNQHRVWGDVQCVMGTCVAVSAFFADANVELKTENWHQTSDLTRTFQNLNPVADFVSSRMSSAIGESFQSMGGKKSVKKYTTE